MTSYIHETWSMSTVSLSTVSSYSSEDRGNEPNSIESIAVSNPIRTHSTMSRTFSNRAMFRNTDLLSKRGAIRARVGLCSLRLRRVLLKALPGSLRHLLERKTNRSSYGSSLSSRASHTSVLAEEFATGGTKYATSIPERTQKLMYDAALDDEDFARSFDEYYENILSERRKKIELNLTRLYSVLLDYRLSAITASQLVPEFLDILGVSASTLYELLDNVIKEIAAIFGNEPKRDRFFEEWDLWRQRGDYVPPVVDFNPPGRFELEAHPNHIFSDQVMAGETVSIDSLPLEADATNFVKLQIPEYPYPPGFRELIPSPVVSLVWSGGGLPSSTERFPVFQESETFRISLPKLVTNWVPFNGKRVVAPFATPLEPSTLFSGEEKTAAAFPGTLPSPSTPRIKPSSHNNLYQRYLRWRTDQRIEDFERLDEYTDRLFEICEKLQDWEKIIVDAGSLLDVEKVLTDLLFDFAELRQAGALSDLDEDHEGLLECMAGSHGAEAIPEVKKGLENLSFQVFRLNYLRSNRDPLHRNNYALNYWNFQKAQANEPYEKLLDHYIAIWQGKAELHPEFATWKDFFGAFRHIIQQLETQEDALSDKSLSGPPSSQSDSSIISTDAFSFQSHEDESDTNLLEEPDDDFWGPCRRDMLNEKFERRRHGTKGRSGFKPKIQRQSSDPGVDPRATSTQIGMTQRRDCAIEFIPGASL